MQRTLQILLGDDDLGALSYETTGSERMAVECDGAETRIFANREAFRVLAQIFGKLALGQYEPGFHVHLRADLGDDATEADVLTVTLVRDDENAD